MNLPFEGALVLRRRSSWEAADAGLLLWRANFVYFLPFFALPVWFCAFGLRLLPEPAPWSWLILWYLKPLFDRLVLHVISVRFFEPAADAGRLFRGLRKTILRGLPGDLLWRRFSPLRSAMMPLRVLERLRGKNLKNRKRDLKKAGLRFCGFLTLWGFLLEYMLLGGEILFSILIVDIIHADYISSLTDFLAGMEIFFFAVHCFNYMLVESIYVCMGFGLYINSRMELEGWDIEILLKKFAEGRKKKTILPRALALLLFLGLLPGLHADAGDVPLETLERLYEAGYGGGEKEGWGIRVKNPKPPEEISPDFDYTPWVEKVKQSFAAVLRVLLILVMGALVFFAARYLYKNSGGIRLRSGGGKTGGLFPIAGEDPEALLKKAQALYGGGELRRAWGFCLAALLAAWSRYRRLNFPPDATEYGCLALVRASAGAGPAAHEAETFAAVIKRWVDLAYGGRRPPAGSFEEALAFCQSLMAPPENVPEGPDVR
jgi:hypothetical protein